jgi:hypothetical protein
MVASGRDGGTDPFSGALCVFLANATAGEDRVEWAGPAFACSPSGRMAAVGAKL